jgi:hypothetical protein
MNHFYAMKPPAIGSVTLGEIPRVVAIIDEFLDMRRIGELKKAGVDILEIRIDKLGTDIPSLCVFIDKIKKNHRVPLHRHRARNRRKQGQKGRYFHGDHALYRRR